MPTISANPYDLASAVWCARFLAFFRAPVPGSVLAAVAQADGHVLALYNYVPPAERVPAYFWWFNPTGLYIAIDGASTYNQAAALMDGYYAPLNSFYPQRGNENLWAMREAVWDGIPSAVTSAPFAVYCFGWSLGGAIAEMLPIGQNPALVQNQPFAVTSFGAPRAGTRDWESTLFRWARLARFMNDDDPVPLIPPTGLEWPPSIGIYGISGVRRANQYIQPRSGVELRPDGTARAAELPSNASLSITTSIASYLLGQDSVFGSSHQLVEYVRRLSVFLVPNAVVNPPNPAPVEPARHETVTELNQIETQSETAIFRQERAQNTVVVNIPAQQRVYAFRIGRVWYVGFRGDTIGVCGSKRKARQVARRMNAFLDTLQDSAAVDIPTLVQQFTAYLADASSPSGGFAPVMNTQLP